MERRRRGTAERSVGEKGWKNGGGGRKKGKEGWGGKEREIVAKSGMQ